MIKKLILGMAVCTSVFGMICEDVIGMEYVKSLISDLAKNPSDREKLTVLVQCLIDEHSGNDNTYQAIDVAGTIEIPQQSSLIFDRIVCMVFSIAHDWCCGYNRLHTSDYYIGGVTVGKFGPYLEIPNDLNS